MLLLTRGGDRIVSDGWKSYQTPVPAHCVLWLLLLQANTPTTAESGCNQNYELDINLELARIGDFRYHRPYIAVWVENQDHFPIRTIALWFGKMRYLPELRSWYHGDQRRSNVKEYRAAS